MYNARLHSALIWQETNPEISTCLSLTYKRQTLEVRKSMRHHHPNLHYGMHFYLVPDGYIQLQKNGITMACEISKSDVFMKYGLVKISKNRIF
jgi:hypothetical protein